MAAPRVIQTAMSMEQAKEVRLLCPHCNHAIYVPHRGIDRQKNIKEAIDEHRKLCEGAPIEAMRVYRIDYPRL